MRNLMLGALGAATMILTSVPAWGQELPIKTGDFWDVAAISIDVSWEERTKQIGIGAQPNQLAFYLPSIMVGTGEELFHP